MSKSTRSFLCPVIMLVTVLASGGVVMAGAGKDSKAERSLSKWIGSYESVSGSCGAVIIEESKITWGSCRAANAKLISVSSAELVVEVDPLAAQCGWAGFIVGFEKDNSAKTPQGIIISAYQSLDDQKAKNRYVQCSYSRKAQ